MPRRWFLVVLVLLATLAAAHVPTFRQAWTGEITYSLGIDRCAGPFAARVAPGERTSPSDENCDTIYSQRMAWDGWRRLLEAWDTRSNVVSFLFRDLWDVAVSARALNIVDLMLFVWPAHLLFGPAGGMVALHLGLVALGAGSGVILARALQCSPAAGLAAGIVTGGSGLVIETTMRGQYPQAVILGYCLFFAGMARVLRGDRWGAPLFAGGLAFSALLYWMNGLILGLGAVVFLLAQPIEMDQIKKVLPAFLVAGVAAILVCVPAAIPVVQAMASGAEDKMAVVPWGTPYPTETTRDALMDLIDEVPWFVLSSPRTGWIPALPLLPFAIAGVWGRARISWLILAVVGLILALGPWPCVPWGSHVFQDFGTLPRGTNPVYTFVYQWFPLASRMHHPMRWAGLATVAFAAATALGVDVLRARFADQVWLAVGAGLLWVVWVGPWPLPTSAFPKATIDTLADCDGLVLPAVPPGERELDDIHRLEGLLWMPRAPATSKGGAGVGKTTPAMAAWSEPRVAALSEAFAGNPPRSPDPLEGMCILYSKTWVGRNATLIQDQLKATFGEPVTTFVPTGLFAVDGTTRTVEVYRRGPIAGR